MFTARANGKSPRFCKPNGLQNLGLLLQLLLCRGQAGSELQAPPKRTGSGEEKQGQQTAAKQQAGHKPAAICAFIGAQCLNTAIQNHGDHQKDSPECTHMEQRIAQSRSQNPCQLPCTACADRKPPPMIMERPVIPAMAAAEPGQPDIQPGDHCIMARPTPAAITTT